MKKLYFLLALFALCSSPMVFALNDDRRLDHHKEAIATYCIKPGDLAIDVGANAGVYTFPCSVLVGETGLVIAYEANPYVFAYLTGRINWWVSARGINNIISKEKAASNSTNEKILMKVYPGDDLLGCGTVEPYHWNETRMPGLGELVEVETEQLDDLLRSYESMPITFIKIDVEGHEHAVFDGAKKILTLYRPVVIFEYGFTPGVWEPSTIAQIEEMGYACFDLRNDQRVAPRYASGGTDLLAVPIERLEEFTRVLSKLYPL